MIKIIINCSIAYAHFIYKKKAYGYIGYNKLMADFLYYQLSKQI